MSGYVRGVLASIRENATVATVVALLAVGWWLMLRAPPDTPVVGIPSDPCAGLDLQHGCALRGATLCLRFDGPGPTRAYALQTTGLQSYPAPGSGMATIRMPGEPSPRSVRTAYIVSEPGEHALPVYVEGDAALCMAALLARQQ